MNGKIDWSELFFSADGRVSRMPFLVAGVIVVLLLTIYAQVVRTSDVLHLATGLFVYPLFVFTGVCILSKRLHDRGRSGWWSLLIVLAFALAWPFRLDSFWQLLGAGFLLWAAVELAVMPGEQGANRFGPNPQRPPSAPAAA